MTEHAALTEEMTRLLDEHPREARDNRFNATVCGEMAVMRFLHSGDGKKMTAGELSSRLSMTTSRMAAVLGSLEKKGLLERENDAVDRRRVLVSLTQAGHTLCEKRRRHFMKKIEVMLSMLGDDAPDFVRLLGRAFDIMATDAFKQCDDIIEEDKEDFNG